MRLRWRLQPKSDKSSLLPHCLLWLKDRSEPMFRARLTTQSVALRECHSSLSRYFPDKRDPFFSARIYKGAPVEHPISGPVEHPISGPVEHPISGGAPYINAAFREAGPQQTHTFGRRRSVCLIITSQK